MNVNLTPMLDEYVRAKVESGRYNSASEVVREALRLLEEQDQLRRIRREALKRDIQEGLDALERGDYTEINSEEELDNFFEDIKRRSREELAAERGEDMPERETA